MNDERRWLLETIRAHQLLEKGKKEKEAETVQKKADALRLTNEALDALRHQQFPRAQISIVKAIQLDPQENYFDVYVNILIARARHSKSAKDASQEAVNVLHAALGYRPDAMDAHLQMVMKMMESEDFKGAKAQQKKVIRMVKKIRHDRPHLLPGEYVNNPYQTYLDLIGIYTRAAAVAAAKGDMADAKNAYYEAYVLSFRVLRHARRRQDWGDADGEIIIEDLEFSVEDTKDGFLSVGGKAGILEKAVELLGKRRRKSARK